MARPVWSGFIRLSLVSVPVKAFTAEAPEGRDFAFHQLHKACHSRIRYRKVCPIHGEVDNSEIVTAYEYAKGKYVEFDPGDKPKASLNGEKGIVIENFVGTSEIDPLKFEGSSYYLLPDGEAGEQPYALLCQAMLEEKRWALAEAVLWRKERLILLRPEGKLLTMSLLRYAAQLKSVDDFADEAPAVKAKAQELRLARRLIAESSVDRVDWAHYQDDFRKRMSATINEKVAADEVVESESDGEPGPVINLMDALKRSVASTKRRGGEHTIRLPNAASKHKKPKAVKRKSPSRKRKAS